MPSDHIPGMVPGPRGGFVPAGKGTEGNVDEARKFDPLVELGTTGINRVGTWRATVEFDWQPELRSAPQALKAFREIASNEPMAFAALQAIDLLLRQVEWRVEPYRPKTRKGRDTSDAEQSVSGDTEIWEDQAAFIEECMHDLDRPWSAVISEALTMVPFGFSLLEIVHKVRRGPNFKRSALSSEYADKKIGWAKFSPRAQESIWQWVYSEDGELVAARQMAASDFKERVIPMQKCLHFRTRSWRDSPYGVSCLRGAWIPAYYLKRLREIEGIGVERDLTGMPVAYVPPELLRDKASPADVATRTAIQNTLQNVRRDAHEGMLFPLSYDANGNREFEFQLMASGGSRQSYIGEIITRYEQRVVTSLLADFLLLGQAEGAGGSYALSRDKTTLFSTALQVFLQIIADEINAKAVSQLYKLNGWNPAEKARIVPGQVGTQDANIMAGFISTMAASGAPVWPNFDLYKHALKVANLPEPSEQAEQAAAEGVELQRRQALASAGLDENGEPLNPPAAPESEAAGSPEPDSWNEPPPEPDTPPPPRRRR